jgi:hypothetical protein
MAWLPQHRPGDDVVLLENYPDRVVRLSCRYCDRTGRYGLAGLVRRFGPAAGLPDVLAAGGAVGRLPTAAGLAAPRAVRCWLPPLALEAEAAGLAVHRAAGSPVRGGTVRNGRLPLRTGLRLGGPLPL